MERAAPPRAAARRLAAIAVGIVTALGAAAVGLGSQIHAPKAHDEFSYLLAADTFAEGRLANPPHPAWEHFESYHVNQQPTYASKYPPAQGLFLAAGQVVAGHPIAGVWLGAALMCAAICWMLLAWFPVRWAVLGALLAAARFGVVGPWAQSYWGGAVAALGGALLLGAVPRIVRRGRWGDSVLAGTGVALLANSRPYEGLVLCIVVGAGLAWHRLRRGRGWPLRRLAPAALVLAATFAWMGYYNHRVTGSATTLPYTVNAQTYQRVPLFQFQSHDGPPPAYRHAEMRRTYEAWTFRPPASPEAWLRGFGWRARRFWSFFLGPWWSLGLVAVPFALRRRGMRLCLAACVLVTASHSITTYGGWPHYVAPATGALMALLTASLQRIARLRPLGLPLGGLLVVAFVGVTLWETAAAIERHPEPPERWQNQRQALFEELVATPGDDLVIVHYDELHNFHQEWVYNRADIDAAPVVWARSMGPERDRELLRYFADRKAWRLHVRGTRVLKSPIEERGGR